MTNDNKNLPAKRDRSEFLDRVRSSRAETAVSPRETLIKALANEKRPRLLFAMDATASRQAAWNVAKEITGAMFEVVPDGLDVALAYHGGGCLQEMTPFSSDAKVFLDKLQMVRCQAGETALNQVLAKAKEISHLKALIYIGDCFEEDEAEAIKFAEHLKLKGVRCFMFHDSSSGRLEYDTQSARTIFEQIARLTGGALLPFDETAPQMVKALLEAIALFAVGGIKALEQKTKYLPAARLLLEQISSK
ncbi:MAG TPA: hypothetical protein DEV81_21080 [Cyanobacteria bacterium UBA11049]|nr:hypothetical protein [Cyanobacteria bacterium UBA11049]